MTKIKISELQSGWVLTDDVYDLNGRFLMGRDCKLTDKHIRALQAWGVNSVAVSGDDVPEAGQAIEIPKELMAQIEVEQQVRFQYTDMHNDFIKELYQQSVVYLAKDRLRE